MNLGNHQNLTRTIAWLTFFGAILLAWVTMFAMSWGLGIDVFGKGQFVDFLALCLTPAGPNNIAAFPIIYAMWALMMAAMMGPTFVPTARSFEDLIGAGAAKRTGFYGLITGYILVWIGFAAIFASAQIAMQSQGWLDILGASASGWLTFGLLFIAGLYQFTSVKDACLSKCRSPMTYFIGHWRAGLVGGLRMGADIGIYCLGCCWAMMSLGFIGGVMNLVWMGVATLIMTLEKLPDIGRKITRPLGFTFLLAALLVGVDNFGFFNRSVI
jgi:predicted metal-binding membrane protein